MDDETLARLRVAKQGARDFEDWLALHQVDVPPAVSHFIRTAQARVALDILAGIHRIQ